MWYINRGQIRSNLEYVLYGLLHEEKDFRRDNPELIKLTKSDWEKKVREIFG
jgi:hypothetical protein